MKDQIPNLGDAVCWNNHSDNGIITEINRDLRYIIYKVYLFKTEKFIKAFGWELTKVEDLLDKI